MSRSPYTFVKLLPALLVAAAASVALGNEDTRISSPIVSETSATSVASSTTSSTILGAIADLESQSDAKCHSSASRFEDFLYGTPLGDAGRRANTELQKELALRIWGAASQTARQAGEVNVAREHIQPQLDALLQVEEDASEQIRIRFSGQPPLTLSKIRAEQYASIAYSLRAILALQQESLLEADDRLLPLTPDGLDRLRQSIDWVTLSALLRADRRARERNEFQIDEANMRAAWQGLLAGSSPGSDPIPTLEHAAGGEAATPRTVARAEGLALLDELIAGKVAAYRVYNGLSERQMEILFMHNLRRFYARVPIPKQRAGASPRAAAQVAELREQIVSGLVRALDAFSLEVLALADTRAARSNDALIRADAAHWAVQQRLPHEIDDFEDVHLYSRLPTGERVTLEAHDCDSLRDSGIHWPSFERALHAMPDDTRLPDPFAAEIIAEAISQYAVLLLRLAGDIAKRDKQNVRLHPDDLLASAELIRALAERHHATPQKRESASGLAGINRISSSGVGSGGRSKIDSQIHSGSNSGIRPTADEGKFFSDVTSHSGVEFVHRSSDWLSQFRRQIPKSPPTYSGGGVAAEDVNGDSHTDLLFVGGIGNALLLNDGRGRFTDVTQLAGIALLRPDGSHGEARNPIIADFDNDDLQDILISYVDDENRLYRNTGGGRFEDVSAASGLGGKGLVAGALAVFDYDGDGLLDIYIAHMGNYLERIGPLMKRHNDNALPNRLFRNRGGMRFEDVTEGSGVGDPGWTQAVSHADIDRDGRQDIIVANDFGRNSLLRNLGGGKFENVAAELGMTKAYHSMNVGIADLNADGYPDLYISNIATLVKDNKYVFPDSDTPLDFDLRAMAGMLVAESDVLYMSRSEQRRLVSYEPSADVERGESSTGWAWDAEFFDFDLDGDEDLYLVNGTNDYNAAHAIVLEHPVEGADGSVEEYLLGYSRESNVFFMNEDGKLRNVSSRSGADYVGNSRSTAYLDLEGDGDLDIAVNNFHAPAVILRNNLESRGMNWLKLRLIGDPARGSNRDAIGARIVVTDNDALRIDREVRCGSGFLSMNPKQQHFGLGRADTVDLWITWPNGEEQRLHGVSANRAHTVRQGAKIAPDAFANRATRTNGG